MTNAHQLFLVDLLYLGAALGMGLWFRAWLRQQQRAMDERLAGLEAQQAQLARLGERLQGVCRGLEGVFTRAARGVEAPRGGAVEVERGRRQTTGRGRTESHRSAAVSEGAARGNPPGQGGARREDPYGRARELLSQGVAPAEVARRVGLGIAEVNVLRRMQG